MDTETRMVPYARGDFRPDGMFYKTCPECGAEIDCHERKDFESFSGIEYAEHVEQEHPDKIVRLADRG